MTAPNLRAYPAADGGFTAVHVDPRGCAWTVCAHPHDTEAEALRCAGLELDDAAVGLWLTHRKALGLSGPPWGDVPVAEANAWRLVALSARHGCRHVEGA